jgi:hypothetical protein
MLRHLWDLAHDLAAALWLLDGLVYRIVLEPVIDAAKVPYVRFRKE